MGASFGNPVTLQFSLLLTVVALLVFNELLSFNAYKLLLKVLLLKLDCLSALLSLPFSFLGNASFGLLSALKLFENLHPLLKPSHKLLGILELLLGETFPVNF